MKEWNRSVIALVVVLAVVLFGCENEEIGSLNATAPASTAQPVITSVVSPAKTLAGVDTMIVNGANFSTDPTKNIVYFESTPAQIIDASASQLRVKIPLVVGDSVRVRVAVQTADQLSETVYSDIDAALAEFGGLTPAESGGGITTDATGNLYMSVSAQSSDIGVFRVTPAGVRTSFAPASVGVASWNALRWGPNDTIYAARNVRALYYFPPGGAGTSVLWVGGVALPVGTSIADVDFDQNKYMWAVGTNASNVANARIFCFKPNKAITSVGVEGAFKGVRVFAGNLYFSGARSGVQGVWRAPILNDSLGAAQLYFDLSAAFPGRIAYGMAMASDGTVFLGTDAPEGIIVISPAGSASAPFVAYQSLMTSGVRAFAWGQGDDLFAVTNAGRISKVAARMTNAPTYAF